MLARKVIITEDFVDVEPTIDDRHTCSYDCARRNHKPWSRKSGMIVTHYIATLEEVKN